MLKLVAQIPIENEQRGDLSDFPVTKGADVTEVRAGATIWSTPNKDVLDN